MSLVPGAAAKAATAEAERLRDENELLRARLEEAEETLQAIRSGEVDAIVTVGPAGEQVYTLMGAERPYRVLIEAMQEGAATLTGEGTLLYANAGLARMVGDPLGTVLGTPMARYLHPHHRLGFAGILATGVGRPSQADLALLTADGRTVPVHISINPLPKEDMEGVCMVVTDLSEKRRRDEERDLLQTLPLDVGQAESFEAALITVLRTVCVSTGWEAGEVWLPSPEGLRQRGSWTATGQARTFLVAGAAMVLPPGLDLPGRVWTSRTPEQEGRARPGARRAELAEVCGLGASVGIPVVARDEVVAVVVFYLSEGTHVEERLIRVIHAAVAPLGSIIQRRQVEQRVSDSLREKEALLKEVHHRVKNNLQVVSAMLALQAHRAKDPNVRELFRQSEARIRSMALIHETLYGSPDLGRIDFSVYIAALTAQLASSYVLTPGLIRVDTEVEHLYFEIERAVPVAFIVHELVSNGLKHAFPRGRRGVIRVVLRRTDAEELELIVADDGVGAPPNPDERPSTMGMQVVRTLVRQLDGRLEIRNEGGVTCRVLFPSLGESP